MSEPDPLVCPACGAARAPDGTPACDCADRASDARREARTAEVAAAEDFDPVRIRPFVGLGEAHDGGAEVPPPAGESATERAASPALDSPTTVEESAAAPERRRRRRAPLIAGAGALLAVAVTGASFGGLFGYDGPERDGAADGLRAPLPDAASSEAGSAAAAGMPSATSPASSGPSADAPSATRSTGASPTPTGGSGTPSAGVSDAAPSGSGPPSPTGQTGQPPVLRRGDRGPEVVELQLRLRRAGLYAGEADGVYGGSVEGAVRAYQLTRVVLDDESGVYGRPTRAALEAETPEP
ncbi:peptidoglycan-binding protein [Streptomyces sp. NPDC046859]|uniref:peptidoglycan-binding domain-containing protein n=1 Tax=Streptomyces sp. NPDC046859 TaxID=3155734 RepID=UPI003404B80B